MSNAFDNFLFLFASYLTSILAVGLLVSSAFVYHDLLSIYLFLQHVFLFLVTNVIYAMLTLP